MLRHLTTVLFSFVVPALSLVTSYASGTPCVPDCQQSTYNGPFIQVLQLSPTCFSPSDVLVPTRLRCQRGHRDNAGQHSINAGMQLL